MQGDYSGILQPGRHYLELRPDLSNLGEVLERARDEEERRALTDAAYQDIVASSRHTYRGFVEQVERVLFVRPSQRRGLLARAALDAAYLAARVRDRVSWLRIAWRHRRARGWRR